MDAAISKKLMGVLVALSVSAVAAIIAVIAISVALGVFVYIPETIMVLIMIACAAVVGSARGKLLQSGTHDARMVHTVTIMITGVFYTLLVLGVVAGVFVIGWLVATGFIYWIAVVLGVVCEICVGVLNGVRKSLRLVDEPDAPPLLTTANQWQATPTHYTTPLYTPSYTTAASPSKQSLAPSGAYSSNG